MNLKEKIDKILASSTDWHATTADKLIEEIIKPIAKEAFEAGFNCTSDYFNGDGGYTPQEVKRKGIDWTINNIL